MKRSEINRAWRQAVACFERNGWALPPEPRWDITDFGLGDFKRFGLVLINLATEPEYCEKLMYAEEGQTTPSHTHAKKKEDIICRAGRLGITLWAGNPRRPHGKVGRELAVSIDGKPQRVAGGRRIVLRAGQRITLIPGVWHEFAPEGGECVIGEVSTANDDLHDNFFADPAVGRFPGIEEDEPAQVRLVGE